MHNGQRQLMLFALMLLALVPINCSVSNQTTAKMREDMSQILKAETPGIINMGGDVSLEEKLNRIYWNPHSTGLTSASFWKATFQNETEIFMKTNRDEAGHVAAGAWWTTSFKSEQKLQLYNCTPVHLLASFRVNVVSVELESGEEWLRIALACAIQRVDGSVLYTEMDFYDSPRVLVCPFGNIMSGGNVVYRGGDVVEYKIDQTAVGEWTNYLLDLTDWIDSAWSLKVGDALESVYVIVEVVGCVTVAVKVDDLWIAQVD